MVNPGGEQTMLGLWRMALKQAGESAKAGRFAEALTLTLRPDVADHRRVVEFRGRLALDLIARASRRAQADDVGGAIEDLDLAERFGAAPDTLAAGRLSVADRAAEEVRADLELGEAERVVSRVDELARHKVGGPALRRAREAAEAWKAAVEEARRGEHGRAVDHLDRAERLAGAGASAAMAGVRRDLEARQKAAQPKIERLYAALAEGQWTETLTAAEAVLETIAEHPAARQARTTAWHHIGAISPAAATALPDRRNSARPTLVIGEGDAIRFLTDVEPSRRRDGLPAGSHLPSPAVLARKNPPEPVKVGPGRRFLLWADAIGGYLVCLDEEILLGRAAPDGLADVPLLGDVARRHATLRRDGDGYVIRAHAPTFVNNRPVETAALRNGDVIRLGGTLELEFRQPSPASATARLAILSRHRLPLAVDGVILMGETCIIGPSTQAHVRALDLAGPIVLYRQGEALWCRAPGAFEVDGRSCVGRSALSPRSSVLGEGYSFSFEPLEPKSATA